MAALHRDGREKPRPPDQWSPIGFRFSAYLSVDAQLEVSTRQSVSPLSELTLMSMSGSRRGCRFGGNVNEGLGRLQHGRCAYKQIQCPGHVARKPMSSLCKAQSAFVSAVVTSTKLVHSVPHEHETVGGCRVVTGLQRPEFVMRVAGALCDVEPDAKPDERSIVHAPVRLRVQASALRAAP